MVNVRHDKVRTVYMLHAAALLTQAWIRCLLLQRGCWVLESGVWSKTQRGDCEKAVEKQPEGTGVRSSTTGKVCRKSLGHCRSQVSWWMVHKQQSHSCNPLPHLLTLTSVCTGKGNFPTPQAKASSAHVSSSVLSTAHHTSSLGISPEYPCLRQESASVGGGWVLKYGTKRADTGRGTLLAMLIQPTGWECGPPWPGIPLEEVWPA